MDMERITLDFRDTARLLQELRELGRNLHPARFAGPARAWLARRAGAGPGLSALDQRGADGRLTLTFEVIYGHALKPQRPVWVQAADSAGVAGRNACRWRGLRNGV